ncbi:MAG: peptidylprolyl isomerase [Bacteroidota bacterium]
MKKLVIISQMLVFLSFLAHSQTLSKETVVMETSYGTIKMKLYEETPLHKANFLKLAKSKFYNKTLFHRVIASFMIQGGDPLSKKAKAGDSLGHGDLGYTVAAEINEKLIHKRGALCAARESDAVNPLFASSASQFYIVVGKKRSLEDLKKYEDRINKANYANAGRLYLLSDTGAALKKLYNRLKEEQKIDSAALVNTQIEAAITGRNAALKSYAFNPTQIKQYTTIGGTPHLDGTYTVFGEVTEGMEVVEWISKVKTDKRDRPIEDMKIKVKVID